MRDISIVGGGPAGALCGERLASEGFRVSIFDERLAWEKPCGGGLTHKAIQAYPFLLEAPQPKKIVRTAELISGGGHRARFEMSHPIVIYSRKVLNGLLLERAAAAGCKTIRSRVTNVDTGGRRVRLTAGGEEFHADFVVLAAGARNQLVPETTALGKLDLELTLGYFVPTEEEIIKVKFLREFEGYIWSFPRADHLSVESAPKWGKAPASSCGVISTSSCARKKFPWKACSSTATCCLRRTSTRSGAGQFRARIGPWREMPRRAWIPLRARGSTTH